MSDAPHVDHYTKKTFDPVAPLLAATTLFAIFGPTFDSLCSTGIAKPLFSLMTLGAIVVFVMAFFRLKRTAFTFLDSYYTRLENDSNHLTPSKTRKKVSRFLLFLGILSVTGLPVFLALMGLFETLRINIESYLPDWLSRLIVLDFEILSDWNIKTSEALQSVESLGFCGTASFHWTSWVQLLLASLAVAVIFYAANLKKRPKGISLSFPFKLAVLLFACLLLIVFFAPRGYATREADYLPYINMFGVVFILMGFTLLLSRLILPPLIRSFRQQHPVNFNRCLEMTELFQGEPQTPALHPSRILYGLLINPAMHPLHLLLLPALVTLTFPNESFKFWAVISFLLSWILVTWGGMYWRWNQMIFLASRYFFRGLPLLVSLAIIGIGIARLLDVHYVATLLGAARFGAVTLLVIMLYSLSWLFDHFVNRELTQRLLSLLGDDDGNGWIAYQYQGTKRTDVQPSRRYLQAHGASRLAVVGILENNAPTPQQAYHIWDSLDLFRKLAGDDGSSPLTQDCTSRINAFRSLRRRVLLYQGVMAGVFLIVLVAAFILPGAVNGNYADLQPAASVKEPAANTNELFSLSNTLKKLAENQQPAILVAASGGGTRAALYAYSVLRGIAEQGLIRNVVLTSGVSGGGVSLAYFATHHQELVNKPTSDPAWSRYRERMAAPFVNDVLESVLEPRIYWKTRLGILLEESFSRHFGLDDPVDTENEIVNSLRNPGLGMIFNTSITAHPCHSAHLTMRLFQSCINNQKLAYTPLSGGRLIFTNVQETALFQKIPRLNSELPMEGAGQIPYPETIIAPDVYLPFRVIQDQRVKLTQAGALNANFPPVFFDAPVQITTPDEVERYYVTDGGATDNRGLISLLIVLQQAIDQLQPAQIPPIQIVVAEASATSHDYTSMLGLGTAFSSAKERLANGLINKLNQSIRTTENNNHNDKVHVTYLNMPIVLRSRGGLGTHWMMPGKVILNNPYTPAPVSQTRQLDARQFKCAMDLLYGDYDKLDRQCQKELNYFHARYGKTDETLREALWFVHNNTHRQLESPDYHMEQWDAFKRLFKPVTQPISQ